ncbi:MAG: DUF4179 domain-containing protein [Lachnospiraceae bacterium]|jgi:hypothetical protein|nr:DUF4179 domain-containing protein [Lachnospiraceae bacterium]MCI9682489.1 DUF4179 domain-containing protein [Lachnospiraceae bacterium]
MSIKGYKNAFSGIEPSKELHDSLLQAVLEEENMKMNDRGRKQMKRTGRVRPRLIAACAAVMILGVSMTTAAAFDLNDIFKDFFKREVAVQEEGNEPSAVPLEARDDFLTSAGNVIHEETTGDGLKLTLRGTVGDGNVLYAALDVETADGSPFREEQEGSVQSYRFEEVMLEGEGIGGDELNRIYCGLERIDDGSVPGKATFLLSEMLENDFKGKEIKMSLKNLMVESNEVVDLEMDKTIWELMQEFEPIKIRENVQGAGLMVDSYSTEEDAEGNVSAHESFIVEKTDKRIAFSSKYPEASISNLGIWKGQYEDNLIVNLDFGGAFDWDLLDQKRLIVIDRRTGEVLDGSSGALAIGNGAEEGYFPGMENQADIVGEEYVSCRYCFNDIGESQVKNAIFALGGDGSYEELFGGEWTLSFQVDYEDTMQTWELKEKAAAGNVEIKKVQISPVSAVVEFDTLSDERAELEDVSLKLKDGNQVGWSAMSQDSDENGGASCRVIWKSVVELDEIQSIIVNGTEIEL